MSRAGVDIIIPIYNALDYLKECLDSIRMHTDLSLDRVIMIDDCSPDPLVWPWVEQQKSENIIVMQNEHNLGFSGTINRGISMSCRDVILLNTDTVVTSGWVDKICRCAYSDPDIATVTPFSNAATICSIPQYLADNTIPHNLGPDYYNTIVEKTSIRRYPRISVAVGFCMYIKREVIDLIGVFDAQTFQLGYGEENDFCWRASEMGYSHRLCDDTFIYHKGTASFVNKNKEQLQREHTKVLWKRYPLLMQQNELFVSNDQNADLREAIALFAALDPKKKNILFVLHNEYHSSATDLIGGTELHVRDLERSLRDQYNVFVAAREGNTLLLTVNASGENHKVRWEIGDRPLYFSFTNGRLKSIWKQIVDAFGIGLVHVHHLEGLSLDIFDVCKTRSIPVVFSLHDFLSVCPTIKLIRPDMGFCLIEKSDETCKECLRFWRSVSNVPDYLGHWRNEWLKRLESCEQIIAPSHFTKGVVSTFYPSLSEHIDVIEHGTDYIKPYLKSETKANDYNCKVELLENEGNTAVFRCIINGPNLDKTKLCTTAHTSTSDELLVPLIIEGVLPDQLSAQIRVPVCFLPKEEIVLSVNSVEDGNTVGHAEVNLDLKGKNHSLKGNINIAALGGIAPEKGSRILANAVKNSDPSYNWFLFGFTNDATLLNIRKDNFYISGRYEREQLSTMLEQYKIDVICIPSVCPETFSYTLSEAWSAGIPVIVTGLGAVGDRVSRNGGGWVLPDNTDGDALLKLIQKQVLLPGALDIKKKEISNIKLNSVLEMIEKYNLIYKDTAVNRICETSIWPELLRKNRIGNKGIVGYQVYDDSVLRTLAAREDELRLIKSTKGYRALEWARRIKFRILGIH